MILGVAYSQPTALADYPLFLAENYAAILQVQSSPFHSFVTSIEAAPWFSKTEILVRK